MIDPIDGTVNYFYGIPHFCISIALRENGEIIVGVIYDPMRDELWHAELGGKAYLNDKPIEVSQYTDISQSVVSVGMSKTMAELEVDLSIFQDLLARARKCRMMGSAALDLAYVATGRFDAYIERSVNWWDIAAGVLWSIVPVDGWLSLQAQFKRETVGDCVERKNRPRSTHQDISMSLLESVSMCIAPLEIHFPKIGAESILENITLAGGLLPGHRIVSFVRNTITFVLSETRGQNDQTYLLTNALVSLFFSDAPNHAIDFLEGEAAWFLKSYHFRSLLAILAWNRSAVAPSNGFSAAAVIDWLSLRSHVPASRNRANDCRAVTGKHEAQGRLPISEVEPIELAMELLFDFLSTLEFRPRLLNVRIAGESF